MMKSISVMAAAAMISTGLMFPRSAPRVPLPMVERLRDRRTRKRLDKRERRREVQADNRAANLRAARQRPVDAEKVARQRVVNKLTNWQRTQWAKAGYPADVGRFAVMARALDPFAED